MPVWLEYCRPKYELWANRSYPTIQFKSLTAEFGRWRQLWKKATRSGSGHLRHGTVCLSLVARFPRHNGSIESGKGANFVLTRRNPIENIENASEIESVVVGGKYLDRRALDAMLANVKRIAQSKQSLDKKRAGDFVMIVQIG